MQSRNIIIALVLCMIVIGMAAAFASSHPDGLEWVAAKLGFEGRAADIAHLKSPMPDYSMAGINSSFWSTAVSGVFGLGAIYLLASMIFRAILRKK